MPVNIADNLPDRSPLEPDILDEMSIGYLSKQTCELVLTKGGPRSDFLLHLLTDLLSKLKFFQIDQTQ